MSNAPTGDGIVCPVCNTENPAGSRFCEHCGTRLPVRPREATSDRGSTEIAPPTSRDEATVTFQRLPSEPAPRGPQEPAAPEAAAEPEPFERTLIGTPPLAEFVREERATGDDRPAETTPPEVTREEPPAAEPASVPRTLPTESLRDRPTMTFQLPDLSAPSDESRNAATVSFDLPKLPAEDRPAAEGAADREASAPAPPASSQPGEGNWNYQSWRPDPVANQPAPVSESGGTRPTGDLGDVDGGENTPPIGTGAPPPTPATPPAAPPARQEGIGAGSPPGYPSAAPGPPSPPGTPAWPPAGVTYPSVSAGQTRPLQPYAQPPAAAPRPSGDPSAGGAAQPGLTAYPTPVEPKNNRALWIILGIVAAVIFICVVACILLALLGAVGGAGASSSFATVVPTVTR